MCQTLLSRRLRRVRTLCASSRPRSRARSRMRTSRCPWQNARSTQLARVQKSRRTYSARTGPSAACARSAGSLGLRILRIRYVASARSAPQPVSAPHCAPAANMPSFIYCVCPRAPKRLLAASLWHVIPGPASRERVAADVAMAGSAQSTAPDNTRACRQVIGNAKRSGGPQGASGALDSRRA